MGFTAATNLVKLSGKVELSWFYKNLFEYLKFALLVQSFGRIVQNSYNVGTYFTSFHIFITDNK